MKYTIPDYYKSFQCIADQCPATCCEGWQIVIDEKSLHKYQRMNSPFGNRIKNSINWEEQTFYQYNRRCAFLNDSNLCDIYTEAGPEYFCKTCKNYPRHIEEFENEREISLSLSCPVVARYLLSRTAPVSFISAENKRTEEYDDFPFFLYSALLDSREVMLSVLQNRSLPLSYRVSFLLVFAHDIQNRINTDRIFDIQNLIQKYTGDGVYEKLQKKFARYRNQHWNGQTNDHKTYNQKTHNHIIYNHKTYNQEHRDENAALESFDSLYDQWEVLNPDWPSFKEQALNVLRKDPQRLNIPHTPYFDPSVLCEQVLVYFLTTYFCGAVYDYEALAKVKMSLICTFQVLELIKYVNIDYEDPDKDTYAKVLWEYSRELEHSDLNLKKTEEWVMEAPEASLKAILCYIMANIRDL